MPATYTRTAEKLMRRNPLKTLLLATCLPVLGINWCAVPSAQAGSWLTNSPMGTARQSHTATLLQNGKLLVAGGFNGTNAVNTAELYDPVNGTWTPTGPLNIPRYGHTTTLLSNGKVLAAGGYNTDYLTSAELYDPATGTWALTGPLNIGRFAFTATLMPDGRVLAAGGSGSTSNTPTAELYDPATGSWTQTGSLQDGRAEHTATLLPDGIVLVAGGVGSYPNLFLSSMELYDPSTGTWALTGSLAEPRYDHTATLLPNGLVLLAGGYASLDGGPIYSNTEVYNPSTGTATSAAPMNSVRAGHTATLLPNGTVVVIGGAAFPVTTATNSVEVYDPSTDTWTPTNSLNAARDAHTATLLPNGEILVTGGATNDNFEYNSPSLSSTELYDPTINPTTGTWNNINSMLTARSTFTMTLLPSGKVLIAGGQQNGTYLANCELYDPITGTWTNTGSLNYARFNHTATLLPSGKVLVIGGAGSLIGLPYPEIYDPATEIWTTNRTVDGLVWADTATLLRNGKVLVAGSISTNSAELYDPNSDSWTVTGPMITPRTFHKAISLPNGKVLVVGGSGNAGDLRTAEIYDPVIGQWNAAGTSRASTDFFTAAALLPNGNVIVVGSDTNNLPIADLYNPLTGTWTMTASPGPNHFLPSLIPLLNGKILLVGEGAASKIYDPTTSRWSTSASMNVDRQDDRAVLLPDGTVLDAGGDASVNHAIVPTSTAEIYDFGFVSPNLPPPQITSITSPMNLGGALSIAGSGFRGISEGSSGSFQDSATDYPLVQLRNMESAQTTFLLSTNWSTNSFTSLPVWNFPPGFALATVFVNGIQSTSSIVSLTVPSPVVTTLSGAQISTNGSFQFSFTNTPGTLLGMLASTNLSLPAGNWTKLSGIVETSPGQFQFQAQPTNGRQNFYRLFAP
jgi:Kelch motif/Galactose oxidase, central domain